MDGFRLDAAKHLYENFPHEAGKKAVSDKNTAWWRAFREGLAAVKPDVYLVGEVWDTAAVIGPYLDGAFDAAFNFDIAGRMIAMAKSGEAIDIGYSVGLIHDYYEQVSGGAFEDAVILSNHSEGTERVKPGDKAAVMNIVLRSSEDARLADGIVELPPYAAVVMK